MLKKYGAGLEIGAVYLGAIIGAGFATGQELMRYFVRFGAVGAVGLTLCALIFAAVGFKVLYFMYLNNISDYRCFLRLIMGDSLGRAAEAVSFLFIIALYSSMLAASGALTYELFGLSKPYGSAAMALLCLILSARGIKGLGIVSALLCPVLVIGSVITGLRLYFGTVPTFSALKAFTDNVLFSAIVYTSYNVISSVSLLCALSKNVRSVRDAIIGSATGGILIGIIGLALALPLYKYFDLAAQSELPILHLNQGGGIGYVIILLSAVITTALGNCCSAVDSLCPQNNGERIFLTAAITLSAFILSLIGFESIVNKLYYIFGIAGIAELAAILLLELKYIE